MKQLRKEIEAKLWYDELTGNLVWNKNNRVAGTLRKNGYIQIKVNGKFYYAHRIAWLLMFGAFPKYEIDHIDGDKSNNKRDNLRDVHHATNLSNRHRKSSKNTNSYIGVRKRGDKFYARVCRGGTEYRSSGFDSELEAHLKYLEIRGALIK